MIDLSTRLGNHPLGSPLIAASGTVGSVVDFAATVDFSLYGAAVAKSVSTEPWTGREPPRLAPAGEGMLNGLGIPNPGIDAWVDEVASRVGSVPTEVWGSAVGHHVADYATVASRMADAGVVAVEVNLSCPNLDGGVMYALDPGASASVVTAVRQTVDVPVGAKLSPNAPDVVAVAAAVAEAGADWVVLTNTVWGAAIDLDTRRPVLSGNVGGYSGTPIKPIALRCVWEVAQALPGVPIVGCGGIRTGWDVAEYLMAGASAGAVGTAHFATPRIATVILDELADFCRSEDFDAVADLIGAARPW